VLLIHAGAWYMKRQRCEAILANTDTTCLFVIKLDSDGFSEYMDMRGTLLVNKSTPSPWPF